MIKKAFSDLFKHKGLFKKDISGQDIWYPFGAGCPGYIVTDRKKYEELESRLFLIGGPYIILVYFPLLFFSPIAGICFFSMSIIGYSVIKYKAIKGLKRSDQKLDCFEVIKTSIPDVNLTVLAGLLLTLLFFAGYYHLSNQKYFSLIDVYFIGGILLLGYQVFLKIRHLRKLKVFPITVKNCVNEALKAIVFSSVFLAVCYLFGYLVSYFFILSK